MFYIYDLSSRNVLGAVTQESNLEVMMSNWSDVDYIQTDIQIPPRFQGRWIVNNDKQLENIID